MDSAIFSAAAAAAGATWYVQVISAGEEKANRFKSTNNKTHTHTLQQQQPLVILQSQLNVTTLEGKGKERKITRAPRSSSSSSSSGQNFFCCCCCVFLFTQLMAAALDDDGDDDLWCDQQKAALSFFFSFFPVNTVAHCWEVWE